MSERVKLSAEASALRKLLKATDTFERVYLINAPLNPPDDRPVRDYTPGVWPTMGELRALLEAANEARSLVKMKRP